MIVHVKDRKHSRYNTVPECSNCGAVAVVKEIDKDKEHFYTFHSQYKCPNGCIDEDAIV